MNPIQYPYMPEGRTILYVSNMNPYILQARDVALSHSLDTAVKTGSVVVQDGFVIGRGANGSDYHKTHLCERVRRGSKTGEDYELCEGCHPKNHSEPRAIADAIAHGHKTKGADLYLWGHWWCCAPCWKAIEAGGIRHVYLLGGSETLFNKDSKENILGKW